MKGAMNDVQYLGDGVYCHYDDAGRIVLTTGHHLPREAECAIVLEPEVLAAFDAWRAAGLQRVGEEKT